MQTKELEVVFSVNSNQADELIEREERITRAQRNAYYEIGLDLKAIRDGRLYKAERSTPIAGKYSFTTFEEYCEQRWEMNTQAAWRIITAAEAAQKLNNFVNFLPTRESHVHALLGLDKDEDRVNVWKRIIESGSNVTANVIKAEVERYMAERNKNWITLDEWNQLDESAQFSALKRKPDHSSQFNYQEDNVNIEWARWSWNPVTGCDHGCKYCYARDIAERFYPQKFAPSIIPERLSAPYVTKPKAIADNWSPVDVLGHKNVFTCSMADLFGKWVPNAWIEAVLQTVSDNPQWNFLFLSKFPQKMREFEFPDNAWVGTSVDKQGAVARAESAFTGIKAKVKWLSCEPMLERLTFKSLGMFDWVVIGGASKSTQSDAFNPPFEWVSHLVNQCEASNAKVYMKTNLFGDNTRIRQYPV